MDVSLSNKRQAIVIDRGGEDLVISQIDVSFKSCLDVGLSTDSSQMVPTDRYVLYVRILSTAEASSLTVKNRRKELFLNRTNEVCQQGYVCKRGTEMLKRGCVTARYYVDGFDTYASKSYIKSNNSNEIDSTEKEFKYVISWQWSCPHTRLFFGNKRQSRFYGIEF